jgi:hypothetical protein
MRLVDLNPQWLDSGGEGVTRADGSPAPLQRGAAIALDCPCGNHDEEHRLYVPFAVALDGTPGGYGERGWQRTGDTFETLTLRPSILRMGSDSCGWHGFITDGEVTTC